MRFKNQIFLIVGTLMLNSACVKEPMGFDPVGTWEGEDGGEKIQFVFQKDGTCEFVSKKGGEVFQMNGECQFDFSKRPIPLMMRNIPQLNHPVHTIVEFESADEIRIGEGPQFSQSFGELMERQQPVRLGIGQRPEQHTVDHGKHHRRGPDAERQDQ